MSKTRPQSIRYDEAFKEGAINLILDQKKTVMEVSKQLGIAPDTLRNWLKKKGVEPRHQDRSSIEARKIKELEAQLKDLRKEIIEKDETISVLKKSIGIVSRV